MCVLFVILTVMITIILPLVRAEPIGEVPVIVVFVTPVILPLASTVTTGTAVAEP